MPSHWTYESVTPSDDLEQGDILLPTKDLLSLFSVVHPHFNDNKYTAYIITTQSCDLVRRGRNPKALYLSLGVVRPLTQVINKLYSQISKPVAPGIYKSSDKIEIKRFLERLFNQNEQSLGVFYLHEDSDSGIGEPSVAFLRVTISVRPEHYSTLIGARAGRLNVEYRAKLGWLLGNLYARPATRDWSDYPGGDDQYRSLLKNYSSEMAQELGFRWIDDEIIQVAQQRQVDLTSATKEVIDSMRPRPLVDRAIDEVATEIAKVIPGVDPELVKKIRNRLNNNGKFKVLFRSVQS
jgi:hypothetical protein